MKYLIQELENTQKFKEYISDVKNKISPIELSGLADVGKVQIISATSEVVKRPILITENGILIGFKENEWSGIVK